MHTAEAARRDPGRQAPDLGGVHQLHRHAIRPLLRDPARRRFPRVLVERHADTAAPPVPRLAFQLLVEIWPAPEALERERALCRIPAHHADARRARAGSRGARLESLEHRHANARICTAEMKRRAQSHQPAADDRDRRRHARRSGA